MEGVGELNKALGALGDLTEVMAAFRRRFFSQPSRCWILLVMPPPESNFGAIGNSNDGATIVLPLRSLLKSAVDRGISLAAIARDP